MYAWSPSAHPHTLPSTGAWKTGCEWARPAAAAQSGSFARLYKYECTRVLSDLAALTGWHASTRVVQRPQCTSLTCDVAGRGIESVRVPRVCWNGTGVRGDLSGSILRFAGTGGGRGRCRAAIL
eukprot:scaffold14091_cov121-Isochrysis_galbana.AAC.15